MAPKRRMPTRGRPTSPEPDQPPVEPQESVGETGTAPNVHTLARDMQQMRQTLTRLVELFDRQQLQPPVQPQAGPSQPPLPTAGTPLTDV